MLIKNKGKFLTGKIKDFQKGKGWFFGGFMEQELLRSNLVEVAWQNISGKKASPEDKHYHTSSIEINIVISGCVRALINKNQVTISRGEFYVIWPETIIEEVEADEGTEVIVVRAPSIKDKTSIS